MTPEQRRADPMLKPWLRGKVALPLEAVDRTGASARRRMIVIGLVAGLACIVIIGGLMLYFGVFPSVHRVEGAYGTEGHEWDMVWFVLGCGAAVPVLFWVLVIGFVPLGKDEPGRPWRYSVSENGLKITRADGHVAEGPWSEWRLVGYDQAAIYRNVPVITNLYLEFRGLEMAVNPIASTKARRMMRALVQKAS